MQSSEPSYTSGIDVSHYQGEVSWPAVADGGVRFAFIKASDGIADVDPRFARNWAGAKAAGILRGAYHFFRPSLDAKRQAAHFLDVVTMDDMALSPALDVEITDGLDPAALQQGIRAWLETVQAALGCKPVVYTDPSFWRSSVAADFSAYPLWLACYASEPEVPAPWRTWTFWQHSNAGQLNGISGQVDLDYCALSYEDLRQTKLIV
ncbi:MAG TPA: GH25 family lysozyme [Geminicoccaceae bacterium]|nr:GH25 family lysozyme [Geminicoccaceae bacterium]HZA65927.1 GH25 family lysozyme [Geminicoccaceae bacterium]